MLTYIWWKDFQIRKERDTTNIILPAKVSCPIIQFYYNNNIIYYNNAYCSA